MSNERKQLYEGMYIVSATLSDDARQKVVDELGEQIQQQDGTVHKVIDWGRRRLAYDIEERREGHYFILYFDAPTQAISELWNGYHLNPDLVRFMTVRIDAVPEKVEFKGLSNNHQG